MSPQKEDMFKKNKEKNNRVMWDFQSVRKQDKKLYQQLKNRYEAKLAGAEKKDYPKNQEEEDRLKTMTKRKLSKINNTTIKPKKNDTYIWFTMETIGWCEEIRLNSTPAQRKSVSSDAVAADCCDVVVKKREMSQENRSNGVMWDFPRVREKDKKIT